jgi:probable LLM family oxidoreductase
MSQPVTPLPQHLQIGIDSFAATNTPTPTPTETTTAVAQLLDQIGHADTVGIDIFGIGEHHRPEYLDASPTTLLAAAASQTQRIRLTTAVTVLSAADPVRVFQNHATLDIVSKGRAEMIVGRGSFTESFPLFGYNFDDYDDLFAEKLDLLLKIQSQEPVTWSGQFRAPLVNQRIYPPPVQHPLPIWVGIGGTMASCIRAGERGLPLMIAIIGGETHRFSGHVATYKQAGIAAGHNPDQLRVGIHSLGYVAKRREDALNEFYPGYKRVFDALGRERGWSPITPSQFERATGPLGALVVGSPEDVVAKIIRHRQALGGLSRFTFQMNVAALPHDAVMQSIALIGHEVIPRLRDKLG